jgi:hypothetical protein
MPQYKHRRSYAFSRFDQENDSDLPTGYDNLDENDNNRSEYPYEEYNRRDMMGRAHGTRQPSAAAAIQPRSQTRAFRIRLGTLMRQHGCELPAGLVNQLDRLELKTRPDRGGKRGRLHLTWIFERPIHLHRHGGIDVIESIVRHMDNKRATCEVRMSRKKPSIRAKIGLAPRPSKDFLNHKCETITFPVILARGRDGKVIDLGLRMHLTNNEYLPSEVDLAMGGEIVVPNGMLAAMIDQHRGQNIIGHVHPDREKARRNREYTELPNLDSEAAFLRD